MATAPETGNKAAVRRLMDAVNSGDPDLVTKVIDQVFAPDVQQHGPFEATGPQAIKEVFTRLFRAFPDLHLRLDDVIEEGDKVVEKDTVTGTHRGEFNGLPPTGRSVSYGEIFIMRFADGRVAEIWGVIDMLSQLRQLGLIAA